MRKSEREDRRSFCSLILQAAAGIEALTLESVSGETTVGCTGYASLKTI